MADPTHEKASLKSRLADEFRKYLVISLYLFVCFAVVSLYGASRSGAAPSVLLTVGVALGQALIMGKFVLIGEALKPGTRIGAPTLLHRVAWRSLGMLLVLVVLKLIEELVVGLFHGLGIGETLAEITQKSSLSLLAPVLLMLLILIPLMAAIELDRELGDAGLRHMLLKRNRQQG